MYEEKCEEVSFASTDDSFDENAYIVVDADDIRDDQEISVVEDEQDEQGPVSKNND